MSVSPDEPHFTTSTINRATLGIRGDIAFQVARVTHGAIVSVVRPPDFDFSVLPALDDMIKRAIAGHPPKGCAVAVVPDGTDAYVAVTGMSETACQVAAEHIAERVAQSFAGQRLV